MRPGGAVRCRRRLESIARLFTGGQVRHVARRRIPYCGRAGSARREPRLAAEDPPPRSRCGNRLARFRPSPRALTRSLTRSSTRSLMCSFMCSFTYIRGRLRASIPSGPAFPLRYIARKDFFRNPPVLRPCHSCPIPTPGPWRAQTCRRWYPRPARAAQPLRIAFA